MNATTSTSLLNDDSSGGQQPANITAWGVWGPLRDENKATGSSSTLATYPDDNAAVLSSSLGLGRIVHFGFWPGLSWWFSNVSTGPGALSQPPKPPWASSAALKKFMLDLLPAEASGPVQVSVPLVETPLLVTPDRSAAILTLLDWRRTATGCESPCVIPAENISVDVSLPFIPQRVEAIVTNGEVEMLHFERLDVDGKHVRFRLELQYARVVQMYAAL